MAPTTLTNEQLLRAIIEAQVKNGCDTYDYKVLNVNDYGWVQWKIERFWPGVCDIYMRNQDHVLGILLDTEGCKAAYTEGKEHDFDFGLEGEPCINCGLRHGEWTGFKCVEGYKHITKCIVMAWHSGSRGNNVRAALETAYSFLPKQ